MCILMMEKLVQPNFHQEVTQLMDTCMTVPLATEPPIPQSESQL